MKLENIASEKCGRSLVNTKSGGGGELVISVRPYLKAFLVFNVLEILRVYLLTIDLGIFQFIKKFIERF